MGNASAAFGKLPDRLWKGRNAGLISMTDILIAKNLRWLGLVHRIDINRLPRKLL